MKDQLHLKGVQPPVDGENVLAIGWLCGYSFTETEQDHPIEELRGTKTIEVAAPEIAGKLMERVVVVSESYYQSLIDCMDYA